MNERREKQSLQELQNIARDLSIDYDSDYENEGASGNQQQAATTATVGDASNSFMAEMQTVSELQTLEKKLDELNKHKEQLENEINEFKDDLNLSLNGVNYINKRLSNYVKQHSTHPVDSHEATDNTNSSDSKLTGKLNSIVSNCPLFEKYNSSQV